MQMLTRSGWTPSNDIEVKMHNQQSLQTKYCILQKHVLLSLSLQSILVQIRAEIMSDPNVRLDDSPLTRYREYTEQEAKDAFERMVRKYGWNR